MKLERAKLVGGSLLNITLPIANTENLRPGSLARTEFGLGHKTLSGFIHLPDPFPTFRFRHINYETEGWADIVIVPVASARSITTEVHYRAALQEVGFDTYYMRIASWRNENQDWGPDVVPALDSSELDFATSSSKYVLISAPPIMTKIPTFLRRVFDSEYGKYGSGTWICIIDTADAFEVSVSTLQDIMGSTTSLDSATYNIPEGGWIMGVDPQTENR